MQRPSRSTIKMWAGSGTTSSRFSTGGVCPLSRRIWPYPNFAKLQMKIRWNEKQHQHEPSSKMNLSWRAIVQALVWPFIVIELEIASQSRFQLRNSGVVFEVYVLVLDSAPE